MRVRPFRADDAPALARIFFSAIHEIARAHYSAEQICAWAPQVPDPNRFITRGTDGRSLLIAVGEEDEPLAYGDVEPNGHIDHLFCRPDVAGTGVAAKLYEALEEAANVQGIATLFVEASEPAQHFFAKRGFATEARHDFELGGIAMHNFRMTKRIAS